MPAWPDIALAHFERFGGGPREVALRCRRAIDPRLADAELAAAIEARARNLTGFRRRPTRPAD